MMSLKKKAAQIDLGRLVAGATAAATPKPSTPPNPGTSSTGMTAIGMHAETVYRDRKIAEENKTLKDENAGLLEKLAGFDGSEANKRLNPQLIRASKWANRDEQSFSGKHWDAFKEEIQNAGGNIQPIKVRGIGLAGASPETANDGGDVSDLTPLPLYEVVFGHRRHRACLELGLPVLALVEDATDLQLFEAMDRENRQRADLTIYEQGEMYRRALDEGLYPSLRKLAESLGVGLGNASEAVRIARLPGQLLDAFASRLDIQRRWAGPLADALQQDPDVVLAAATEIRVDRSKGAVVKSSEVFKRLTIKGVRPANTLPIKPIAIKGVKGQTGTIVQDSAAKSVVVTLKNVDQGKMAALQKLIQEFIG